MPNHFTTHVRFNEPMSEELKQFLEGLSNLPGGLCAALKQMPAVVRNTSTGYTTLKDDKGNDVAVKVWVTDPLTKQDRLLTQQENDELTKLGVSGWYDWACKYWGTKWGTYDSYIDNRRVWVCMSAWCPPLDEIFQLLCDKFGIGFSTHGRDEDEEHMELMGTYVPSVAKRKENVPTRKSKVCAKTESRKKK